MCFGVYMPFNQWKQFFGLFIHSSLPFQAGSSYMLREYSSKERKIQDILELKVGVIYWSVWLLIPHNSKGYKYMCVSQQKRWCWSAAEWKRAWREDQVQSQLSYFSSDPLCTSGNALIMQTSGENKLWFGSTLACKSFPFLQLLFHLPEKTFRGREAAIGNTSALTG